MIRTGLLNWYNFQLGGHFQDQPSPKSARDYGNLHILQIVPTSSRWTVSTPHVGNIGLTYGQHWPTRGQLGPKIAQLRPKLGPLRPICGHNATRFPPFFRFHGGSCEAMFPKLGLSWPDAPTQDQVAHVKPCWFPVGLKLGPSWSQLAGVGPTYGQGRPSWIPPCLIGPSRPASFLSVLFPGRKRYSSRSDLNTQLFDVAVQSVHVWIIGDHLNSGLWTARKANHETSTGGWIPSHGGQVML